MANDKDKIPFGGRDWNGDGKYDMFDQVTDYYVYKKVTEDWEKNGAWEKKPKKQKQPTSPVKLTPKDEFVNSVLSCIGGFMFMAFAFCQGWHLLGFIALVILILLIYAATVEWNNWQSKK